MNTSELEELLKDCPTLYHMAERGSWSSIYEQGLLSTTALLDLYRTSGNERERIESQRRVQSVSLEHPELAKVVVRDQFPMTDSGLLRCLPTHISPGDWYRLLNGKVFFWLTKGRLLRLLNAGTYRSEVHDVLEISTERLLDKYFDKIWFCPMNSGCTKPMPHPRDENTFRRIPEYPYAHWRAKRPRGERIVEFAIDYSVPDIRKYVTRVVEMKSNDEIRTIYTTPPE
jgi:hypothetical protein